MEDGSLQINGGELKSYLDLRDGNNGDNGSPLYNGIPYYMKELNQFVRTLAMAFNEGYVVDPNLNQTIVDTGHVNGYGLAAGGLPASQNIRFFTYYDSTGQNVSSLNFIGAAVTVAIL